MLLNQFQPIKYVLKPIYQNHLSTSASKSLLITNTYKLKVIKLGHNGYILYTFKIHVKHCYLEQFNLLNHIYI